MMFSMPLAAGGDIVQVLFFVVIIGIVVVTNIVKFVRAAMKEAKQPQRTRPQRPAAQQPTRERKGPVDEVQQFLQEIARQSGATVPSRPRPAQPRRQPPQRRPEPVPPPEETVRRVSDTPWEDPAKRHRPAAKPPRKKAPTPVAAAPQPKWKPTEARSLAQREEEPVSLAEENAGERLDRLLPKDSLKRAVALREILGPCRNARPFRMREW